MRRTLGQMRAYLVDSVPMGAMLSRRARAGLYVARLALRILKQWASDRCPQQAAALAYQTALSLVPILAIAFSLLQATGSLDEQSKLLDFLANQLLPDLKDLTLQLQTFSAKISVGAAGAGGLIATLLACYSLYGSVEKIVNDIWRVGTRRVLMRKFLTFYALVTLMPLLAGFSLYWSGKLISAGGFAPFLVPLGIQFIGLLLTNKLLPYTNVTWRAAFMGALVTAIALEGLKIGFVMFAKQMLLTSYTGVYGPIGLVPLMLVWIYLSWILVLLGIEVAHAVQNLRLLEAEDRRHAQQEPINALVAAQLLGFVAADYERGGTGVDKDTLAGQFQLTGEVVARICARLKASKLIAEVKGDKQGFIPARTAATITMEDVLGAFRATDLETAQGTTSPVLLALVADLEISRRQRIAGLTMADLLPPPAAAAIAMATDPARDADAVSRGST